MDSQSGLALYYCLVGVVCLLFCCVFAGLVYLLICDVCNGDIALFSLFPFNLLAYKFPRFCSRHLIQFARVQVVGELVDGTGFGLSSYVTSPGEYVEFVSRDSDLFKFVDESYSNFLPYCTLSSIVWAWNFIHCRHLLYDDFEPVISLGFENCLCSEILISD
jgi:hypothetical protein